MMSQQTSLFGHALRGLLAASTADVFLKVLTVISTGIILSRISPYEYGLWQLLLSVITAFDIFLFAGIAGMLVAEASREIGAGRIRQGEEIISRGGLTFMGLGALAAAALFALAPAITAASGLQMTELLRLLSITLVCAGFQQGYMLLLQTHLSFVHMQVVKVSSRLVYLFGIALFVFYFSYGLSGIVYAYTLAAIAPVLIYTPYILGKYSRVWIIGYSAGWRSFFLRVWEQGRWVVLNDYASAATGALWPWVVGYFLGVPEIGLISIALMLLGQVSGAIPASSLLRSLLPRTAETPERLAIWLSRSMKYSLWAHIVAGLGALGILCLIVPTYFPAYLPALPLFAFLLPTLGMRAVSIVATEWFYTSRKQKDFFFVSTVPKIVLFLCLPPLVWLFGFFGYVVWSYLSSEMVLLLRLRRIQRETGFRFRWGSLLQFDSQDKEFIRRAYHGIVSHVRA